jgi:hypothetical protein
LNGEISMKCLAFAFFVGGLATHLCAGSIAILNPSFEDQILSPGTGSGYPWGPITDWTESQTANVVYYAYNASVAQYPSGVPDGVNVAGLTENGPSANIFQILTATLLANDTYTFTGYAGLRADTTIWAPPLGCYGAGAVVEAGGNVLTPVAPGGDINCSSLSTGSFREFTFVFSTGPNPAGLGDPLEIVLTANGSGSTSEAAEIDFDDLSLSDTSGSGSSVPEPATFGTMAAALAICVLLFRRRTAA